MNTPTAQSIFLDAIENHSPADWPALVASACGENEELRRKVLRLLEAHSQVDQFMAEPASGIHDAAQAVLDQSAAKPLGTMIGPYKLLEQLGEGGMGIVYVAEQTEPVRRTVALKIIKPGMDSRQVIARFEAERQSLAVMDHPNIAKILDAGTVGGASAEGHSSASSSSPGPSPQPPAPSSRPYFVMELVRGLPITEHCDQAGLSLRARLELFVTVCQAVQHAHQKGIIHRDLKPGNVLITLHDNEPVAKIIDFGVAKAVIPNRADFTEVTSISQLIGTPLYMSPEQAELGNRDIDTRSDVYSLGVLLYELLSGRTPFDKQRIKQASFDEMRRIIREEEPAPLCSAHSVTGHAGSRGEPVTWAKQLRGELQWIVMRALEKDRNRRYESASALAADVQRYLADEPVVASPPSAAYRWKKLARRNKGKLLAGALVTGILLLGATVGTWLLVDWQSRQAVATALIREALDESNRYQEQDRWPEALASAERAEALAQGGDSTQRIASDAAQRRLDVEMAIALYDLRAEAGTHVGFTGNSPWATWGDSEYAARFAKYGVPIEQLTVEQAASSLADRSITTALAVALDSWAAMRIQARGIDDPTCSSIVEIAKRIDPDPQRNELRDTYAIRDTATRKSALVALAQKKEIQSWSATSLTILAESLGGVGAISESLAVLQSAHERYPTDYWINLHLAEAQYRGPGLTPPQALSYARTAAAIKPKSASANFHVGLQLIAQKEWAEAERALLNTIEVLPDSPEPHTMLGHVYTELGRFAEANKEYQTAIRMGPPQRAYMSQVGLAYVCGRQNDHEGAIENAHQAILMNPNRPEAYQELGYRLLQTNRYQEARETLERAIAIRPGNSSVHLNLGIALNLLGKPEEAIGHFQLGRQSNPANRACRVRLATTLEALGRQSEALAECVAAMELSSDDPRDDAGIAGVLTSQKQARLACFYYAKAFSAKPDLLPTLTLPTAYNAPCAAALAAAESPSWVQQAEYRRLALAWLWAGHQQRQAVIASPDAARRKNALALSAQSLTDSDLRSVRDDLFLNVTDESQVEWRALWDDVAQNVQKARTDLPATGP